MAWAAIVTPLSPQTPPHPAREPSRTTSKRAPGLVFQLAFLAVLRQWVFTQRQAVEPGLGCGRSRTASSTL